MPHDKFGHTNPCPKCGSTVIHKDCRDVRKAPSLEQQLYNALAKMWLWQSEINDLVPSDLSEEVKALLGEKMLDAIIESESGATFDSIVKRVKAS